jgi:hypothetical protein
MTKVKSKSKPKTTVASKRMKIEKNHPMEKHLKKLSKHVEALGKAVAELKEMRESKKVEIKKERTKAQVKRRTDKKKVRKLKSNLD